MNKKVVLYGAYGYTGQLIARMAAGYGIAPIIAGRDADRTKKLAQELNLPSAVFGLEDRNALEALLQDADLVINAAGPFEYTCRVMADACLRTRTHYIDITGEMQVFEYFKRRDAEARAAGILFLPGAGFDVVPSDCLSAWLAKQLPGSDQLTLALFSPGGKLSHGTALTVLENASRGGAIRENGKIKKVRNAYDSRKFDFGFTERMGVTIPWGDLSTAFTSTGIPNIKVYNCVPEKTISGMRMLNYTGWLIGLPPVKKFLGKKIKQRPAGPTEEHRHQVRSYIWGEVKKGDQSRRAYLDLPEGYTLTALTTLAIAKKVIEGQAPMGYQTPAMAFGPDFITEIAGVNRVELK